jgi:hypothetical protein
VLNLGTYLQLYAPFYPRFEASRFHQYLEDFEVQPVAPDSSEALLAQAIPGGFAVVTANREGDESDLDLEILFNTVTANPQIMAALCAMDGKGEIKGVNIVVGFSYIPFERKRSLFFGF